MKRISIVFKDAKSTQYEKRTYRDIFRLMKRYANVVHNDVHAFYFFDDEENDFDDVEKFRVFSVEDVREFVESIGHLSNVAINDEVFNLL